MTDSDISKALKEESYLDGIGRGYFSEHRDLVPLLKILRYKALHSTNVYESTQERKKGVIYPSHWLR